MPENDSNAALALSKLLLSNFHTGILCEEKRHQHTHAQHSDVKHI